MRHPIYLVTGPCGSGKTTWIHQQLTTSTEPSAYIPHSALRKSSIKKA